MKFKGFAFTAAAAVIALITVGSQAGAKQAQYKIRWVMAHEPVSQFERAGKHFQQLIERETQGAVAVQILTSAEFTGGKSLDPTQVVRKLKAGELEMSQTYTDVLAQDNPKLGVLDLPLLFRSHEHVSHVVDGPIGGELLAGLSHAGMQGLGFTYSGGKRIISSASKEIRSVADFKGLKIRTSPNRVAMDTLKALGASPVTLPLQDAKDAISRGLIQGSESTLPRSWEMNEQETLSVFNETSHSILMTAIVMNKKFFDSLPPQYRDAVAKAAREAAIMERQVSVQSAKDIREAAIKQGLKVVSFPAAETEKMRQIFKPIYEKYTPVFGADLVSAIQGMN